jgi:MFS family permease
VRQLLPPGRDRRLYLGVCVVDALGSGVFTPISVLYLTQVVGLPAVQVGVGLALVGILDVVATPLAGALVDRVDGRLAAGLGYALAGAGFVLYLAVHSFATFLLVGGLIEVAERVGRSGRRMVAFAVAEGEDRVGLLAYERSTRNVGYGLGGLLASLALATGSRSGYDAVLLVDAASYLIGAVGLSRLPRAEPHPQARVSGGYRVVLRDRRYLALAATSCLLWLNDSILKVGLALWIVDRTSVPKWTVGLLFTLNTALVVALQVRASRGTGTVAGAGRAYRRAGLALVCACVLVALAAGAPTAVAVVLLVLGTVALTLGELFASAAEWGASITLAREELRGRYLAVFALGMAAQGAFGPAVVSAAVVRGGRLGWLALGAGLLLIGLVGRAIALRAARAHRPFSALTAREPAS